MNRQEDLLHAGRWLNAQAGGLIRKPAKQAVVVLIRNQAKLQAGSLVGRLVVKNYSGYSNQVARKTEVLS